MLDALPLANTLANELTLIIPIGLFLLTLAWLGWLLHGRGRS